MFPSRNPNFTHNKTHKLGAFKTQSKETQKAQKAPNKLSKSKSENTRERREEKTEYNTTKLITIAWRALSFDPCTKATTHEDKLEEHKEAKKLKRGSTERETKWGNSKLKLPEAVYAEMIWSSRIRQKQNEGPWKGLKRKWKTNMQVWKQRYFHMKVSCHPWT